VSDYARDLEEMQMVSKEDYLVSLRRHILFSQPKRKLILFFLSLLHLVLIFDGTILQKKQCFFKGFPQMSWPFSVCACPFCFLENLMFLC
jgi:hypothetical protein